MAKKKQQEVGFGSDSFLDVLCNMVGILVILIVIAGMRVSRAPVVLPDLMAKVEPAPPTVLDDPVELGEPQTMEWAVEAPPPVIVKELPPPARPAPLAPLDPPKELVEETQAIQADLNALTIKLGDVDAEAKAAQQRIADKVKEIADAQKRFTQISIDQQAVADSVTEQQQSLASMMTTLATLEKELRDARATAPKVKILKHSTTPVSRYVNGTEVHFRLANNKVSVVPVEMLVERLQAQIQRQRDFLLSREYFEGAVGPIDGYKMEFTLERSKPTPSEELNMAGRLIKMEVTGWQIRVEPGVIDETAEQALAQGSNYLRTVESAGPIAALTFWVYPDSFEAHHKLQEYAQAHGWSIASRPLPDGVPIAGSPKGTKSLAQ
ncbi:MAG: hypothetical protein U0929_19295 [Planctomycetaceae bacterium]